MAFDIPILFLVFNRPETTAQVFQRIKQMQPAKLFIAADGPRAGKKGEESFPGAGKDGQPEKGGRPWSAVVVRIRPVAKVSCFPLVKRRGCVRWKLRNLET